MQVAEHDMSQREEEILSGATVGWNKGGASAQEVIEAQPLNPVVPLAFKPLRQPWGLPPRGRSAGDNEMNEIEVTRREAWSNDAFEKNEVSGV